MKLSSKSQLFVMMSLMMHGIQTSKGSNIKYSQSDAFRISKQGSPESFGLSCTNHKRSNKIRLKRKMKAMKSRNIKCH